MKAGFVGLGRLGSAMAGRLMSEGVDLIVWNRTREKAEALGVPLAESPAALISQVDTIFLCLSDSDAVEAVVAGRDGFIEGDLEGEKLVIDTTTNHFSRAVGFHGTLLDSGGQYLECPVLGSVVPASQGNLAVLVSGHVEAYERALPFIKRIANHVFYLKKPGLATKMKLVNNLVLGVFMGAIAEAVRLGEAAGLDRREVVDILDAGAGHSRVLQSKRKKLLDDDYSAHFSSALMYRDLCLIQDLGREYRAPLFLGSTVKELYSLALSEGGADADFTVLVRTLMRFSGG
jgi:3-hydroxyisobutyrate dehydrogenase